MLNAKKRVMLALLAVFTLALAQAATNAVVNTDIVAVDADGMNATYGGAS